MLDFGRALRARGIITGDILDGYYDSATFLVAPANRGDQYGFTYATARAQARTGSFVASPDGRFKGVPDLSGFMNNLYQPAPPDRRNQQWGGRDPVRL